MSNASSPRSSSGIRSRASSLASWALSHEEAHGLSGLPLASSSEGEARRTEEEEELLPGDFGSDLGSGSSAGDDDDDGIPWSEDEIGSPRLVTRGVQTEDSFADLDRGSSTDGDVTFGSRGVWMRESCVLRVLSFLLAFGRLQRCLKPCFSFFFLPFAARLTLIGEALAKSAMPQLIHFRRLSPPPFHS
eukprot:RCo023239